MMTAPDFEYQQVAVAFVSRGDKLSFKNDNVIIKDADNNIKHQSTCYRLFMLFIVGHASITSGLLQKSQKFNFTLVLMGHNLTPYAIFNHKTEGNVLLRKRQYTYDSSEIAQHLVKNKIMHQQKVLKGIRNKDPILKNAIQKLEGYLRRLPNSDLELHDLLGIEGIAARLYFQQLFGEFDWRGRKPRAKQDPTNVLLDIGYTLLFNFVEAMLNQYGFDLYQGVYHRQFYQRKSLVCDLVEPFRPIIDARIRKAHNLGQIHPEDFDLVQGQYRLFGQKSQPYVTFLIKSLLVHKQEIFIYMQNYYRSFIRERSIDTYPIFTA